MARVRCRDSGDCDGRSEAQDGAATTSHSEGCWESVGCRECVEQAMSDVEGQQKLQEMKQRRATEGIRSTKS